MHSWKRIAAAALGGLLLLPASAWAKRPRPSDVPGAQTAIAPNPFQLYNDYATPERTYASRSAVVHYVVVGIDAPALNDDDGDGVPDYIERVGDAADRALAYYARRGFHLPLPDSGGPDPRPDLYVSRFAPGTLGVAFPGARAEGGAFVAIANNLDPSAEESFASVYATVAHELFHLVQFSYFAAEADPPIPTWILEGTAAALEGRVNPDLDDVVTTIQLRRWLSAADRGLARQSYGAQLFWRYLDVRAPAFLPALFARLATRTVAGEGEAVVRSTYARVSGRRFAVDFHAFALAVAADHTDEIAPALVRLGEASGVRAAPLSIHFLRARGRAISVTFPRGRAGTAATMTYEIPSDVPGDAPQVRRIAPRIADGRTLAFDVPAAPVRNPLLVISNGGGALVRYVVSAR